MAKRDDGGPAFPQPNNERYSYEGQGGMSLRDYFAAKAMQAMASGLVADEAKETLDQLASDAFAIADAMLAAREKKHGVDD